jgi:chromosome segregation ATPase
MTRFEAPHFTSSSSIEMMRDAYDDLWRRYSAVYKLASTLINESKDLKKRIAELEARLRDAEEALKSYFNDFKTSNDASDRYFAKYGGGK